LFRSRGLAPLEEAAESEGKEPGKQEKDHQEHVGDLRLEVRRQLALRDRTDHRPARPHAASATVSERVIDRKKSSSFPVAARALRSEESTRLNSSHLGISYAVFCLKKKKHKQL